MGKVLRGQCDRQAIYDRPEEIIGEIKRTTKTKNASNTCQLDPPSRKDFSAGLSNSINKLRKNSLGEWDPKLC